MQAAALAQCKHVVLHTPHAIRVVAPQKAQSHLEARHFVVEAHWRCAARSSKRKKPLRETPSASHIRSVATAADREN